MSTYSKNLAAKSTQAALRSNKGIPHWRVSSVQDDTPLYFGKKYRNVPMIDVPDDYLLWILDQLRQDTFEPCTYKARLYEYLKDNEDALIHNTNK